MISALAITLAASLVGFTGIWLIHVKMSDVGLVDYFWAPGFFVIAAIHAWIFGLNAASTLIFIMIGLWALRLTSHLVDRHTRMIGEDGRYAAMRAGGGQQFWWKSLFSIFLLQGILQWIIASPLHVVADGMTGSVTAPLALIGLSLFVIGFVFESIADWQLRQFRFMPQGNSSVIESGLWSLCRHPNYLGEMVLWIGIGLFAFAASGSLFAFVGPIILICAMWFVSIPLTELHLRKSRPRYDAYARRTPVLIPYIWQRMDDVRI